MTLRTRLRVRRRWPETVRGIFLVLSVLPRVGRGRTWLLGIGVLLAAALPIAVAVLMGLLIGVIPDAVRDGMDSAAGDRAVTLMCVVAVLVVLARALGPVLTAGASTLGRDLDRYLQERVLAAVGGPRGIAHLEDAEVQNEVRIVRGLGMSAQRPSETVEALPQILTEWLRALGAAAVLFAFHWWLGLLWLVVWPAVVYRMQRDYVRIGEEGYGQSTEFRHAEYVRDLALNPGPAKEVRIWGMLGWLTDRFEDRWRTAVTPLRKARTPHLSMLLPTGALVLALNLASYGLLAWAAVKGHLELEAVSVFVMALSNANSYAVGDEHFSLSYAAITVPRVLRLEERLGEVADDGGSLPVPSGAPKEGVRFEGVRFSYPGADREVLHGLDLTMRAGQSLAIVGENGAGKTSLVKLLCGLYEPTGGRITVDGTDLAGLDPGQWRGRVAALFQDFGRYHLPVRDNIAFGAPGRAADMDALRAAAEKAGILDVIEELPEGWDTVLSREYTGGVDLSGGQWQRVALARAMFAVEAGARVLVLDEPTAALDIRAEAELYDRFLELTEGLTTCLISHRFSTVRRADRIVVLDGGRVAEDGTHEQLIELDGRYAHMFNLQAERFRAGKVPAGEEVMDA
ncbi:ABC transporter ATP-binding protein [Actinomadura darangshiensis]|uniref:ABC transporter ATP-binding protein n=1 Tax=Actinomadura darangshiensis TaxID=705336 RepID=A0A4R5BHG9_9ACTN|nr:ABC transporter ATP-binding protein [Actinomadura darangshiensis]TDD83152.1 ABC transporter ATP-binding protein [Actinomadura darangshiensis]